jgi:hypothetical protein
MILATRSSVFSKKDFRPKILLGAASPQTAGTEQKGYNVSQIKSEYQELWNAENQ